MKNENKLKISKLTSNQQGIHSRGYLPHIEGAEYQMLTYRLADALPKEVLLNLSKEQNTNKRRKNIEAYIDTGHGKCLLEKPEIAKIITDNWHYFDEGFSSPPY